MKKAVRPSSTGGRRHGGAGKSKGSKRMVAISLKAAGKVKRRGSAASATATARGSATTKGLPRAKTMTSSATTTTTTNRFRKALGKGPSVKQRKLFKLSKVIGFYGGLLFGFFLGVGLLHALFVLLCVLRPVKTRNVGAFL